MKNIIKRSMAAAVAVVICICTSSASYAAQSLSVTDDLGDFSFFKSDYITHRYTSYPNLSETLKGNNIEYEKFDYKNAEKGDRIIFNKTVTDTSSANDVFIDIAAKIFSTYRSSKVYSNFKLSGEFMCNFEGEFPSDGRAAFIYQLRDSQSASSNIDIYPITVYSDGTLQLLDGTRLAGAAANERWFTVEMYVNLSEHTVTMFIDGEKVIDNKKCLSESFKKLNMTRVQIRSGAFSGQLQCRKMEFTGLDKAYNGEEIRTSMFGDDSEIENYLADKVAFHHYGNLYYANGTKTQLTTPSVYRDGDIYVSIGDFNSAFGTTAVIFGNRIVNKGVTALKMSSAVFSDGQRLVPAAQLAGALFDYYSLDDTNGMILISPTETEFDISAEVPYHKRNIHTGTIDRLSNLQYLYDYLLFDRPTKEALLAGFNSATDNGADHPRIMATKTDFDNIRSLWQTDEYMKLIVDDIIKKADEYIATDAIYYKYDDDLRTMVMANKLRDSMLYVGFAYQMTGDTKYSDWVWENLDALNGFPDINPGHPIDTGSYGAGIAIGYDWCYHAFDEAQLANIEMNAKRLHLTVIRDGFYGRSPVRGGLDGNINVIGYYNKWISNYNIWTNYGSVMMSAAFMDTYPELCSDLMAHSIRSLEYGFKNLYPDGAWVESTNYWEIIADGMAYVFGTLNTLYGTDFNLSKFPGTSETGITNMALRSMVGTYNYHDANPSSGFAGRHMAFLAKYFNQPELAAARYAVLTKAFDKRQASSTGHPIDALYFDENIDMGKINELPKVYTAEGLELFAVHEDYTDYDGLFFASHGGPVSFYHSHNDCGDFVFDLNGVRWAESLGYEDYNSSLAGSERYRMRTEGHNTVSINNGVGFNQTGNTYAPIIKHGNYLSNAFAVYDMSDLYADADSFLRGFHIDTEDNVLTIRDEIELNKTNSEIYWFMHTKADVELIDAATAKLTRNGKSVIVNFETNAPHAVMSVMDAVPLVSSPQGVGQNTNDGYRKVAIRITADSLVDLTVRIAEQTGDVSDVPISGWQQPEVTYSLADGAINISAATSAWCREPAVYVAYYNGDSIVGAQVFREFSDYSLEQSCDVAADADSASLFLWDGMQPVAGSVNLNIK